MSEQRCSYCDEPGAISPLAPSAGEVSLYVVGEPPKGLACPRCLETLGVGKPGAPRCSVCGEVATKWDGGMDIYVLRQKVGERERTATMERTLPQFRCEACDPRNKWFAITAEDDAELTERFRAAERGEVVSADEARERASKRGKR